MKAFLAKLIRNHTIQILALSCFGIFILIVFYGFYQYEKTGIVSFKESILIPLTCFFLSPLIIGQMFLTQFAPCFADALLSHILEPWYIFGDTNTCLKNRKYVPLYVFISYLLTFPSIILGLVKRNKIFGKVVCFLSIISWFILAQILFFYALARSFDM